MSFCDDDEKVKRDKEDLIQPLPDLPTFQEELIRTAGSKTDLFACLILSRIFLDVTLVQKNEKEEIESSSKNETSGSLESSELTDIPDDPILDEPLPGAANSSELGSLLRLPKPKKSKDTESSELDSDLTASESESEPESESKSESKSETTSSSSDKVSSSLESETTTSSSGSELVTPPPLPRTIAPGVPEPSVSNVSFFNC